MIITKTITSAETYPLRLSVLWPHFNKLEECAIPVDNIITTFQVGSFKDGKIVSIGTFIQEKNKKFEDKNQFRLRAMATSLAVRGEGFGKQVIKFGIKQLKNKNVNILWCDAREAAFEFYEKMGFKTVGNFYNIPSIGPHKLMYIRLENKV